MRWIERAAWRYADGRVGTEVITHRSGATGFTFCRRSTKTMTPRTYGGAREAPITCAACNTLARRLGRDERAEVSHEHVR